jgi:GGDEF domain-containing protein/putative methionine-R-sulfoxide reductase with GAF domain
VTDTTDEREQRGNGPEIGDGPEIVDGEYEAAFRHAPEPLWLEDHSGARERLLELGLVDGPGAPVDLAGHLIARPDLLRDVVARVRILDVNDATLTRWGLRSLDELRELLADLYTQQTLELHARLYAALARGETVFSGDDVNALVDGGSVRTLTLWAVQPGCEEDWRRLVIVDVDITDRVRAEDLVRTQRDAAVALSMPGDRSGLFSRLIETLMRLEEIDAAGIHVRDDASGDLVLAAHAGVSADFATVTGRFPKGSIGLSTLRSGEVLFTSCREFMTHFDGRLDGVAAEARGLMALAAAPVLHQGTLVAVVTVSSRTVESFSMATRSLLESVLAVTGGAFARLAAEDEARRRLRLLEAVAEIQHELLARHDGLPFDRILPRLLDVSGADRVYVFAQSLDTAGEPRLDPLAEYVVPGVTRQMDDPAFRDLSWDYFGPTWRTRLERGESIAVLRHELTPERRAGFDAEGVLALLLLPLTVSGELRGMISFGNCHAELPWPEPDVALLASAAAAVSTAMERRAALQDLRTESARSSALMEASRSITSTLDFDRVLATIARQAAETLDCSQCVIWEYLSETNEEVFLSLYEREPQPGLQEKLAGARYSLDERPYELQMLQDGDVVEERLADPRLHPLVRAEMEAWGERATLRVPLVVSGTLFGEMIVIETDRDRRFSPAERRLAAGLGELAAAALSNARLHRRVQDQLALRHELLDLSESLLSSLAEPEVFARTAELLRRLVDYDSLSLGAVDDVAGHVTVIHAAGKDAELMQGQQFSSHTGVTGSVLAADAAELVNDMLRDPRSEPVPGTEVEEQASIIVPLRLGTRRGVLLVDRFGGRRFAADDLETVRLFAGLAAVALENARLYHTAEEQAISDGLTGLYNHRHFYERLEQEIARARRSDEPLALLMIDIDDFKQLNDRCGHPVGDDVLRSIGLILQAGTRHGVDLPARYGGEEFAVILPGTRATAGPDGGGAPEEPPDGHPGERSAVAVAERIREAVERGTVVQPSSADESEPAPELGVTVSIGVAVFPTTASTMSELVAQADAALYLAKRRGKDRVEAYGIR